MLKRSTDPFLQSVKPPRSGQDEYTDMAQEGLILRVSHTGRKHGSVIYRRTGQGGYTPRTGHELKGRQQRLSICLLYTSPSPRDRTRSRMPSSA